MYYENICIQPGPAVITERRMYKESNVNCLVQVLHTLVSILPCDKTEENELCHGHYGYASVGKIVAAGKEVSSVSSGQYLLLPPVFSKYIVLDTTRDFHQSAYPIRLISPEIDRVHALFISAVCIGFHLLESIKESYEENRQVLIFGHTLMAEILYRVLCVHGIDTVIIDDDSSCKHKKYIYGSEYWEGAGPSVMGQGVIFGRNCPQASHFAEKMKDMHFQWYEIPDLASAFTRYVRHDLFAEVMDYQKHNEALLQELLVEHVHAESIRQTCKAIEQYKLQGPCLVYDW